MTKKKSNLGKRYFLYSANDGQVEVVDTYADRVVGSWADKRLARNECKRLSADSHPQV